MNFQKNQKPKTISMQGFINEFTRISNMMSDRHFTFILGAGASLSSGIPTASELVEEWLDQLYVNDPNPQKGSKSEWTTSENLKIDDFDPSCPSAFYSEIYDRVFEDDPEAGHAFMENVVRNSEPSPGYSVLAQIVKETRHNVVITTNFDDLVAQALLVYTNTSPTVCGHESLAEFIKPQRRNPLVVKIHRDIYMSPKSSYHQLLKLPDNYSNALKLIFEKYTPIIVGYSGNDGTLMSFLENLPSGAINGKLYWCFLERLGEPNDRIQSMVSKHSGRLVPIHNFDHLFLSLSKELGLPLLYDFLEKENKRRIEKYHELIVKSHKHFNDGVNPDQEFLSMMKPLTNKNKEEKRWSWGSWLLKIQAEHNIIKKEALFKEALSELPYDPYIHNAAAIFYKNVIEDYDTSEKYFRRAVELEPNDSRPYTNLAMFLYYQRKNYTDAEKFFEAALKINPNAPHACASYASLLYSVIKNYEKAGKFYRRALEFNPNNAKTNAEYAWFSTAVSHDNDEADKYFNRAIELDPDLAMVTANYAWFSATIKNQIEEAKVLFERAMNLEPGKAWIPTVIVGFNIMQGNFGEAKLLANHASDLMKDAADKHAARLALYQGLLLRLDGSDDSSVLNRLYTLLTNGFITTPWTFNKVLKPLTGILSHQDYSLYSLIASVILEDNKFEELNKFDRWKSAKVISLKEPWDRFN